MSLKKHLPKEPTWRTLVEREPRLKELETEAKSWRKTVDEDFCANAVWFNYHDRYGPLSLKERMSRLVGWDRKGDPILGTTAAFDVAYDHLYGCLPDCRHDGWVC